MYYEAGRVYEGYFYARAKKDTVLWIVLESEDGKKLYAQNAIGINSEDWQQYHFALTPEQTEIKGRITIELRSKGSIDIGYILFQPGEWGRYKNLNVRKDVAEKLHELHVTIMRFGGSMINNPNYKWKYMLNKPEERIEYAGTWYNYSSMGFGIIEFMELCEALGIPGIPVFNSYETHQDISDFIDFALSVDEQNIWVRERLKRGHQQPYRLPYLEFGNEERVDEDFMQRFIEMADQVWSKTIDTQLIIGDFAFINPIEDPYRIKSTEAPSGISSLEPYKKLLDHSVKSGRSIWFDLHWDTSKPDIKNEFNGVDSFIKWLKIISPESLFKIVILELNADKHDFERALANALTINRAERRSGIYQILCSANGLQVDKNNDNYWNQGLIFFDHEQIWLQPPAFATQMASEYYLPYIVAYELTGCQDLDITISKNHDSSRLIIKCINISMNDWRVTLQLSRDLSLSNITRVVTLNSLKLDAVNKPGQYAVVPAIIQPNHLAQNTTVVFHAKSFTIIEIVDR
jgi:alpha-L-arabinofuranosidase